MNKKNYLTLGFIFALASAPAAALETSGVLTEGASNPTETESVTITKSDYCRLLKSQALLACVLDYSFNFPFFNICLARVGLFDKMDHLSDDRFEEYWMQACSPSATSE